VFMGDTTFWAILDRLGHGRNPLIALNGADGPNSRSRAITLQDLGEVVLDGGADHVDLNGIDRWLGGVHLMPGNLWRWDATAEALTFDDR
jgi:hypothetical protein